MSICVAMILPIALGISGARKVATRPAPETQSIRDALHEACRHRGYLLLLLEFYVCGFQVNFIGSHLPAHIVDAGVAARWGAIALMLVAFFNMIGSWGCGWIGDRYREKYALSILYTFRTLLIVGFMVLPVTPWTIVIFSAGVGLTWLGTLPLVSGIIVDVFGVRYMAMLFGVVYFIHQLGAFTGFWLGGYIFDTTGIYDAIWLIAILLGVATAITRLPIDDRPVAQLVNA